MATPGWILELARILCGAADLGAVRVTLQGLRPPAARRVASELPQTVASAVAAVPAAPAAGQRAWRQASWGSVLPFAAAGVLAAALAASEAHCEGGKGGADGLAEAREAVMALWQQLDEQLQRAEAGGAKLDRLPLPAVTLEGGDLVVEFFVPQSLDVAGALHELRHQLRNPAFGSVQGAMAGSSVAEESSAGQAGRAWTFRRRSKALGDLTVEVEVPRDPHSNAWFSLRAKQGKLGEQDLRLIAAALHTAVQPKRQAPRDAFERDFGGLFGGGGAGGDPLGALGPLGRMFEGLEPFIGHIQDMMEDFQRMQQGVAIEDGDERDAEGVGFGEERDIRPTPLRRHKRWDELPGGSGSSGGNGGGGRGGPGGEDGAEEWEQRRRQARMDAVVKKLQSNGAQVFLPGKKEDIDWGILAGYEGQKRQIEDTVLLALMHPEVYDEIARRTRRHYSSNRPRAVLFEGPPGTGKTTSARVIATQAAVPLVYIPLEAIVSKWYGESERMLADMLKQCESFPDGCIIFLDELDALATSRGTDMHEATRRLLGVLLRHLDGFDANKKTVVIGATNRRQDLDPALISRFSATVNFDLPNEECRAKILRQYAQHLSDAELLALARATPGMAGRDLRDVCEQAERHWASQIIRGKAKKGQLPPLSEYLEGAQQRLKEMAGAGGASAPPSSFL